MNKYFVDKIVVAKILGLEISLSILGFLKKSINIQ